MPAVEIRAIVGEDVWSSYYTWCVERNPWDKVISDYYFRFRVPETRPPLRTFIESGLADASVLNLPRYTVGGKVAVDLVARYEDLTSELARVERRLGLPSEALVLPRAKAHYRTDRRHYSAAYRPAEADLVAQLFAEEIALHRYRFDRV